VCAKTTMTASRSAVACGRLTLPPNAECRAALHTGSPITLLRRHMSAEVVGAGRAGLRVRGGELGGRDRRTRRPRPALLWGRIWGAIQPEARADKHAVSNVEEGEESHTFQIAVRPHLEAPQEGAERGTGMGRLRG
jgi:hypothetical protein